MRALGVDVGGTFTDAVYWEPGSPPRVAKVLTRVHRPWASVAEAAEKLTDPTRLELIIHATTLGTNMLLGQVGLEKPEVVLLTSRGFRDVLEIGRQARPDPYNAFFVKPRPLVPRHRRLEIDARLYADGSAVEPRAEEVERLVAETCRDGVVYVIAVINCFRDGGALEERVARLVAERCPGAVVEWSCRVDPRPGEYERTSTAVVNALLRPLFSRYLTRLEGELRSRGFRGDLLVMQSSGGVAPPDYAAEHPVYFIESGPAAGAVGAAFYARLRGEELVAAFDMGGTTAKASLIVGGEPLIVDYFEVGGRFHAGRLVRGSGYPVRVPHVDLVEVSAGGGTVVWVDAGGGLRVGPLSVGSEPGPACYGRGGTDATLTDAHLVLGRLPPVLAGGLLELDAWASQRVYEAVAEKTGLDLYEAAAEALRLANVEMARALRLVTVERGVDPGDVTLYAFGGAGPLHAAELAEELGIPRVYVPPYPGVFSALGLLVAERRATRVLGIRGELDDTLLEEARRLASEEARRLAERIGCRDSYMARLQLLLSLRGQGDALRVEPGADAAETLEAFRRAYVGSYGVEPPPGAPPVVARGAVLAVYCGGPREPPRATGGGRPCCKRRVYFLSSGWTEATVYRGAPREAEGPAIVELETSTVVVPPGWRLVRDEYGGLLLEAR